jgi:hypothetical protein
MKLNDIINADFADLIHSYNDVELVSFNESKLTIKTSNNEFIQELLLLEKVFKVDVVDNNTIICY